MTTIKQRIWYIREGQLKNFLNILPFKRKARQGKRYILNIGASVKKKHGNCPFSQILTKYMKLAQKNVLKKKRTVTSFGIKLERF